MDWKGYTPSQIRNDKHLFAEFSKDYLLRFGQKVNPNCGMCFADYLYKYLTFKPTIMLTDYKLKQKYNGISFFGEIFNNGTLTDKKAKYLLEKHPAGKNLFDNIPVEQKVDKPKKQAKELKTDE